MEIVIYKTPFLDGFQSWRVCSVCEESHGWQMFIQGEVCLAGPSLSLEMMAIEYV